MGTSLTGLTPATTYDALIKVGDNGPLSATAKVLSDGLGNDSVVALSTSRVGINTTTPAQRLNVKGTSGDGIALTHSNNNIVAELIELSGAQGAGMLLKNSAGTTNILLNAGGESYINGGNVGIGTSTPPFKLSVSSSDTSNSYPTNASIHVINYEASNFGRTMGINFAVGAGSLTEIIGGVYGVYTGYTTSTGGALSFVTNNGSGTLAEKARITSDGYLRLASGTGGIQFNGDTAASNALDDYEEGTWTPVFSGATTAGNYTYSGGGSYTKIGNQVTAWCTIIDVTQVSAGTGDWKVSGLPFTISNNNSLQRLCSSIWVRQALNTRNNLLLIPSPGTADLYPLYDNQASGGGNAFTIAGDFQNNMDIGFAFTYFV